MEWYWYLLFAAIISICLTGFALGIKSNMPVLKRHCCAEPTDIEASKDDTTKTESEKEASDPEVPAYESISYIS